MNQYIDNRQEIRTFGHKVSHTEAESFIQEFVRNTRGLDSNTSLAIFIQKLVGTASNWFEVQDELVRSNFELLLETFKNEFLENRTRLLFSAIQNEKEDGLEFYYRIRWILKESGIELLEADAVTLFVSKLRELYRAKVDGRGIVGFDSLKSRLKYLDLKISSGQTKTGTKPGVSVIPKFVDNSSVTIKREVQLATGFESNIRKRKRNMRCWICKSRGHTRMKCDKTVK